MEDELLQMKNLGKTFVQWLHLSGIHSAAQLRNLGAVGTYRAVKTRGFGISMSFLYAIEGALLDKHWCDLPPKHKEELIAQLTGQACQHRL